MRRITLHLQRLQDCESQARLYHTAQKTYVPERPLKPSDVAEVVLSVLSLPPSAEVTDIAVHPMCSPHPA